jgi:hypothetical protein
MGQRPAETDTSFVQQDTTAADATMSTDSVGAQGEVQADTTSMTGDTTSTTSTTTDTTSAAVPADTAGTADITSDSTDTQ